MPSKGFFVLRNFRSRKRCLLGIVAPTITHSSTFDTRRHSAVDRIKRQKLYEFAVLSTSSNNAWALIIKRSTNEFNRRKSSEDKIKCVLFHNRVLPSRKTYLTDEPKNIVPMNCRSEHTTNTGRTSDTLHTIILLWL